MKIKILGIGSNSFSSLHTTSFLLYADSTKLLIDCGVTIPRIARASCATQNLTEISTLVLTHRHLDHCGGVPYFLIGRHLDSLAIRKKTPNATIPALQVIAEADTWEAIRSFLSFCHPDIKQLAYEIEHQEIRVFRENPGRVQSDLLLTTVAADHTVPAYGLVFQDSRGSPLLAYSTDTLPTEDFLRVARGAKVVIHEAMVPSSQNEFSSKTKHATSVQAGAQLKRLKCERAYLFHLRPVFFDQRGELEAEATEAAGQPVRFPAENEIIEIS